MKKIYFKNLNEYFEQEITIEGFVDNIRDLQYVQFLVVRDTTGKVQVTIEKNENNSKLNEIVSNLTIESTVKITGTLLKNEKVKLNGMELIPNDIIVTSKCLEDLPLNYKDSKSALLDTRLNYRFLDLRSEKNILMFKVQTCMINAMREFVVKNNFTEIHTPKIISAASESGAEVFEVKYFDRKAYLAQSPQFYKQMAMCSGFEKVFEIAPAFRAENSNSYRHTTDFTSFDIEMSYIESLEELMNFEEDLFIAGLSAVKEKYGEQIKELFNVDVVIPTKPFPRIKLEELYKELEKEYGFKNWHNRVKGLKGKKYSTWWWTKTAYPSFASGVRGIYGGGSLGTTHASDGGGCVPACVPINESNNPRVPTSNKKLEN